LNSAFIKAIQELLGKSSSSDRSKTQGKFSSEVDGGLRPLSPYDLLGSGFSKNDDLAKDVKQGAETPGFKRFLNHELKATLGDPSGKRLKIAVFHRNFDPSAGGAENYAVSLVEQLCALHEIHVYAQRIKHDCQGVTYHRVPQLFARPRWLNQLIYATYCAWMTRAKLGFDIIHSHENTWSGNVQTVHVVPLTHNLFAGKTLSQNILQWVKVILSPRLLSYVILEKLRLANKKGRWFIAVSKPLNKLLEYSMACDPNAIMTIPPGIHIQKWEGQSARALKRMNARELLALPENAKCLLWIGHDAQKKGLDVALRALALLPSDYVLIVVGAARPKVFWESLVKNTISGRVLEKGAVDSKALQALYEACDILIHPTKEDTFGMVVLEAMAHGLPVIVSNAQHCGISSELVDNETALILSNPDDPVELAGKVVLGLQGQLKDVLSTKGQNWANMHDWARIAELQNTVYSYIVSTGVKKL